MSNLSTKARKSLAIALGSTATSREIANQIDNSIKLSDGGAAEFAQIATPELPEEGFNLLYFKDNDKLYSLDSEGNEEEVGAGGGGTGDVDGPSSSVDFALARFDGTSGKLLQESPVLINDAGSFFWVPDNTAIIGQPGDNRPKRMYVAENIDIGSLYGGAPGFLHAGLGTTLHTITGSDDGNQAIFCFTNASANAGFIHDQGDTLGTFKIFNNAGGHVDYFKFDANAAGGAFTLMKATGAHILWATNGGGDIGALAGNRPANIYVRTSLQISQDADEGSEALQIYQNTAVGGPNILVDNANTSAASIAVDFQYATALAVNFGVINVAGNHHAFFDYGNGSSLFTTIQEMGTKNVVIGAGVDSGNARLQVAGSMSIETVGHGIKIKEGSNAKMGVATLSSGTVVVSNTSVGANSRIFLTPQGDGSGTNVGSVRVSARTNGASFTITSSDGTDDRVIAWEIKEGI